jgi:hypothetical protein
LVEGGFRAGRIDNKALDVPGYGWLAGKTMRDWCLFCVEALQDE